MAGRLAAFLFICLFLTIGAYTGQFGTVLDSISESLNEFNEKRTAATGEPSKGGLPTLHEVLGIKKLPTGFGSRTKLVEVIHLNGSRTIKFTYHVSSIPLHRAGIRSWERIDKPRQMDELLTANCNHRNIQKLFNDGYKIIHAYYSARGRHHEYSFATNKQKCQSWQYPKKPGSWADGTLEFEGGPGNETTNAFKSFGPKKSKSEIITVR
jgi:hypothetical protein